MPGKREQTDEELRAEFDALRALSNGTMKALADSTYVPVIPKSTDEDPQRAVAEITAESAMLLAKARADTIRVIRMLDAEARAELRSIYQNDKATLADIDEADAADLAATNVD